MAVHGVTMEWFAELDRRQAALIGATTGYVIGIMSGSLIRLVLTIVLIFVVYFAARALEEQFEMRFGLFGLLAFVLVCTGLGPVQDFVGDTLSSFAENFSSIGLALIGGCAAVQIQRKVLVESDDDLTE